MTERRYLIVIEGGDDANYSAYAPDLPGCVATGATLEECERKMREAIAVHSKASVKVVSPCQNRRALRPRTSTSRRSPGPTRSCPYQVRQWDTAVMSDRYKCGVCSDFVRHDRTVANRRGGLVMKRSPVRVPGAATETASACTELKGLSQVKWHMGELSRASPLRAVGDARPRRPGSSARRAGGGITGRTGRPGFYVPLCAKEPRPCNR